MATTRRKSYRFLSGLDDAAFCQRVSDALADGYELYGNPVMVVDGGQRIVGQAIVDPKQLGRKAAARKPRRVRA
ncbi:MAG: DUF1737 domain-containing protein [Alphaproteobacteria bacterium]|nr:DUF1737 domain-containing protein [Alphaproteobacteria bacterium]